MASKFGDNVTKYAAGVSSSQRHRRQQRTKILITRTSKQLVISTSISTTVKIAKAYIMWC